MAWYNSSWDYRIPLTVPTTSVSSDHSTYQVYVDLSTLPSSFFSNVNSDGSDIRVTIGDGESELPVEVVWIDIGDESGEMYFVCDIDNDADNEFYIYYGNSSATFPASDSNFGSQTVWSGYNAVFHMQPITHYKGIEIGIDISASNMNYVVNTFGGSANAGEVTITGDTLVDKNGVSRTVGDLRSGLALVESGGEQIGFIMYSNESVHTRFSGAAPHGSNADHFIAVKWTGSVWQYDNNSTYTTFTPEPDDLLVARIRWGNSANMWAYPIEHATLDSVSNEYIATSTDGPTQVDGLLGSAFDFDGNDWFVLDNGAALRPTTEAGLMAMSVINPDEGSSGYIYSSQGWSSGNAGVYQGFNHYLSGGFFGMNYGDNTGSGPSGRRSFIGGQSVSANNWHSGWTRMSSNTAVTFSVDGVEDTGETSSGTATNLVNGGKDQPSIGGLVAGAQGFKGSIDEVRIRSAALGSSQYAWHADEWLNISAPGTFYSLGTIEPREIIVQSSSHGHSGDNVVLELGATLEVADPSHPHSSDNITLVYNPTLVVSDGTHAHNTDNVSLEPHYTLSVDSASHAHTSVSKKTYYFDASDGGPNDPDSAWSNDANAFDGDVSTASFGFTQGDEDNNELFAAGTNAPDTGPNITGVLAKVYWESDEFGGSDNDYNVRVYSDGLAETLGTIQFGDGSGTPVIFEDSISLSEPTGGWTWPKIQSLETKFYVLNAMGGVGIYKVEAIVQAEDITLLDQSTYYFDASDGGPTDPDNNWTNDANAFDGDTGTYAQGATVGSSTNNELQFAGTNTPTSGNDITGVRVRIYRNMNGLGGGPGYSNYIDIPAPSGGWTWTEVNNLEGDIWVENDGFGGHFFAISIFTDGKTETLLSGERLSGSGANIFSPYFGRLYKVEIEVTHEFESAFTLQNLDSNHAHSADNIALEEAAEIVVAESSNGHTADNVALVQANVLSIQDALHAHSVDNIVLVPTFDLIVAESSHTLFSDNITLVLEDQVVPDKGIIGTSSDSIDLIVQAVIGVNEATHGHTSDNVVLVQAGILSVDEATSQHSADNIALQQHYVAVIASSDHGHSADSLALVFNALLAVSEALHGVSSDNLDLTATQPIIVSDGLHTVSSDIIGLVQAGVLAVNSTVHPITSDKTNAIQRFDSAPPIPGLGYVPSRQSLDGPLSAPGLPSSQGYIPVRLRNDGALSPGGADEEGSFPEA